MNAVTFAKGCYQEKERQLASYMQQTDTAVGALREQLKLSKSQQELLQQLLDAALTDTYITLLYALDGEASLGDCPQETFQLYGADKVLVSRCGEFEAAAYEAFYEHTEMV